MTVMVLTLAVAVAAFWLIWRLVRGQSAAIHNLQDLEGCTRAVDLEAFTNLMDRSQEAYLRCHLPRRQFREVERQRKRAAIEYLTWTAANAALLLRLGETAKSSSDPSITSAANHLIDAALAVRVRSLMSIVILYIAIIFPNANFSLAATIAGYERLREALRTLGQLREPVLAARISSAL